MLSEWPRQCTISGQELELPLFLQIGIRRQLATKQTYRKSCLVLALHHAQSTSKGHAGLCWLPSLLEPAGGVDLRLARNPAMPPPRAAPSTSHQAPRAAKGNVHKDGPNPKKGLFLSKHGRGIVEGLRVPKAFAIQGYLPVTGMRSPSLPQPCWTSSLVSS